MKWPGGGAHMKRKGNIFVFPRKSDKWRENKIHRAQLVWLSG